MSDLPITEVEQEIINEEFRVAMEGVARKWGIDLTLTPINFDEGPSPWAGLAMAAAFVVIGALAMYTIMWFGFVTI